MIPPQTLNPELHTRAALLAPDLRLDALNDAAMRQLVQDHGLELATAILFDRIRRCPRHANLFMRVHSADPPRPHAEIVIGLVPGAFYSRHPHTGADGERIMGIARQNGLEIERIEVEPFGTIERNGAMVAKWLAAKAQRGRQLALVTLSKGTLDASEAVRISHAETTARLTGWLSLSGLWTGTGLVEWMDIYPWRRLFVRALIALQRMPYSTIESLRRDQGERCARPPNARVISVVGVPLREHLRHPWAHKAYQRLSPLGPNDGGGIVLSDMRHVPGEVYPVWGSDHYLDPVWDLSPLISRLVLEVMSPPVGDSAEPNHPAAASAATAKNTPASRSTA